MYSNSKNKVQELNELRVIFRMMPGDVKSKPYDQYRMVFESQFSSFSSNMTPMYEWIFMNKICILNWVVRVRAIARVPEWKSCWHLMKTIVVWICSSLGDGKFLYVNQVLFSKNQLNRNKGYTINYRYELIRYSKKLKKVKVVPESRVTSGADNYTRQLEFRKHGFNDFENKLYTLGTHLITCRPLSEFVLWSFIKASSKNFEISAYGIGRNIALLKWEINEADFLWNWNYFSSLIQISRLF